MTGWIKELIVRLETKMSGRKHTGNLHDIDLVIIPEV